MRKANTIMVNRNDAKLFESITEINDVIFVRFNGYEDAVICKDKNEVYIALNQFRRTGQVKTDENAELIY